MKTITLLKALTLTMGLIIVAGMTAVVCKVADFDKKSKSFEISRSEISLSFPENISSVTPCGDKLCLMTVGFEQGKRLLIVDPDKGRVSAILTFSDRPQSAKN